MTTTCDCPTDLDERMELYCLSRLSATETRRLEAHLANCPACLSEALDTELFLECLKEALTDLRG
jgi:anti-sigma factor RsiW